MSKIVKVLCNFEEGLDPIIEVDSEKNVEVIIDYLIPDELPKPIPENTIRFVVNIQPEGQFNDLIRKHDNYDYLLTFIPELLTLPKARFFIGLTNFCLPDPDIKKTFGVTTVFSGRNCLPGHKLRYELREREKEITIPKWFFYGMRSGCKGDLALHPDKWRKKDVMHTMFHIAIDSYDYPNSFSEKLIDPLITKTIPIYWGPDTIQDYFNMDGIIQVKNVDEIIYMCNSLTEEDYWQSLDSVNENFEKALEFTNYGEQLRRKLQEVLNENT